MSLEVLASFDGVLNRIEYLSEHAPCWMPAQNAIPYLRRAQASLRNVETRSNALLVVALLGGTGAGKSTLVNALLGQELASATPVRPTTTKATLYCANGYSADMLGIPAEMVNIVHADSPLLDKVMLMDCPDPDSTEEANRAALRKILPFCDIILNITTQQKYKNKAVMDELHSASVGASLIWIQTHADRDADIREDWKKVLEKSFNDVSKIFFVDSRQALKAQQEGKPLQGDFAELVQLLTCQLADIGAAGIRRYHFLDIADHALEKVRDNLRKDEPELRGLESKIKELRANFVQRLSQRRLEDLKDDRHQWERLIRNEVLRLWGVSPFGFALQIYGKLDQILLGSLVWRARSLTQLAVLGTVEATRRISSTLKEHQAQSLMEGIPCSIWTASEQEEHRIVLKNAIHNAGLPDDDLARLNAEAMNTSEQFLITSDERLSDAVLNIARKNSRWYIRWFYEFIFIVWIFLLAWLPVKNFFYDYLYKGIINPNYVTQYSGKDVEKPKEVIQVIVPYRTTVLYPVHVYIVTLIWFILGTGGLLFWFSWRTRWGVGQYLSRLSEQWKSDFHANSLFSTQQQEIDKAVRFINNIDYLLKDIRTEKTALNAPELSRRI